MCFTSPLITLALALMLELLIAQLGEVSLPTLNTGAHLLPVFVRVNTQHCSPTTHMSNNPTLSSYYIYVLRST